MSEQRANSCASFFGMDYVTVTDFHFEKSVFFSSGDSPVETFSRGATSAVYNEAEKKWRGTVSIFLRSGDEHAAEKSNAFYLQIAMTAYFTFDAENTPEKHKQFVALLRINGAFSVFSVMRGMVSAATSALGLSPAFITPFWDLTKYQWDELPLGTDESKE